LTELLEASRTDFADAVIAGLSQPRKVLPARFLYDRRGSELFEEITRLPEYYPTRTEIALLKEHAQDIARLAGLGRSVVEFGSGSSAKTPLLLDAVRPHAYVPVDISGPFLLDAAAEIARDYPAIDVRPVVADFTRPLTLAGAARAPLIGFFPGSTIGNFGPSAGIDLLRSFRNALGESARLVIGIDLRKNPRLLEAAYDDSAGVTAAFNLNILHRINRELDGTIPIEAFEHQAVWHDGFGRIEMHLAAKEDVTFRAAGRSFAMAEGETIHTENSYKFRAEEVRLMARASGWEPMAMWTDPEGHFSLHVWAAAEDLLEP
jgi:L-histidine Nalpha-methyltransferase